MTDVEVVARALCRDRIERNHDPLVKGRGEEWLQARVDAEWEACADDARIAVAALRPRFITIGEVEKVARALCRKRIEPNHAGGEKVRNEEWLQRAEDASWMYFTDAAQVALKGMGYVEA